jgi:hypothetical protein
VGRRVGQGQKALAKATCATASRGTLLKKNPIKEAGATAEFRSAATRQSTGSSLQAYRIVSGSELQSAITTPAATASLIPHPAT